MDSPSDPLKPAYVIALYKVWDQSWRAKYREPVIELIKKHSGRYVVRADVCPWEMLEGNTPDINGITVIEFPSMEHARSWHRDADYRPYIELRNAGANVVMMLAEGWMGPFRSDQRWHFCDVARRRIEDRCQSQSRHGAGGAKARRDSAPAKVFRQRRRRGDAHARAANAETRVQEAHLNAP